MGVWEYQTFSLDIDRPGILGHWLSFFKTRQLITVAAPQVTRKKARKGAPNKVD